MKREKSVTAQENMEFLQDLIKMRKERGSPLTENEIGAKMSKIEESM